jgi:hypothetical protein
MESPEISPDPSPMKHPKVQQFVIVKEYYPKKSNQETPKKEKNYLEKNISTTRKIDFSSDKSNLKIFYIDDPNGNNNSPQQQIKNESEQEGHLTENYITENNKQPSIPWWTGISVYDSLKKYKTAAVVGALIIGGSASIYHISKNQNN